MQTISNRNGQEAGFSLVEVSIAMAIAAVALVSLIGLIPQGLKTMQEAGDQAIEARVHQQILSELQLTPFRDKSNNPSIDTSPLKKFHKQLRIYDSQGVELGFQNDGGAFEKAPSVASNDEVDFNWNYSARIWLPAFEMGKKPPSVDGQSQAGVVNGLETELLTVIIEIVPFQYPGSSFSDRLGNAENYLSDDKNFRFIDTFQTTLVRMGQDYTP